MSQMLNPQVSNRPCQDRQRLRVDRQQPSGLQEALLTSARRPLHRGGGLADDAHQGGAKKRCRIRPQGPTTGRKQEMPEFVTPLIAVVCGLLWFPS